jgi:hypothetical protein
MSVMLMTNGLVPHLDEPAQSHIAKTNGTAFDVDALVHRRAAQ